MNFKIVTYKPVKASKYSLMDDLRSARTPMTSKFTSLGSFCAFINLVNSQIDQSASDYKGEKASQWAKIYGPEEYKKLSFLQPHFIS